MSLEVIPPLATQNASGSPGSSRCTSSTSASETERPTSSASSRPRRGKLAARVEDHLALGQMARDRLQRRRDLLLARGRVEQPRDRQLAAVHAVELERALELARRRLHVRADEHESVAVLRAVRVERLGGERRRRLDPAADAHERRAAAVDEDLPGGLGVEQPEHDHFEIGVLGGVDHDRPARLGGGQDLAHALGAAAADVLEPEAQHVGGAHRPARLLLDPRLRFEAP